jgi:hypothetical protein
MATLSDFSPDFVFEEARSQNTLVTVFENNSEQRRAKWKETQKIFKCQYINRPKTDWLYISGFFGDRYGPFEAFTWTNPEDSVAYNVRFMEKELRLVWKKYASYNFEFTLKVV